MQTVVVMLSTYNGEKYLVEQLESILGQTGVNVEIFIRDDGSTDETTRILYDYENKYHNIHVDYSNNIGWKKSFLSLMNNVPLDVDYYAFSDQDDVWLPKKLFKAVQFLEKNNVHKIKAYCSNQIFVDEYLNKMHINIHKRFKQTNEFHVLVNGFGMGCTEVFSRELVQLYRKSIIEYESISHDVLISVLATYFGTIYRDENSYILYRQHINNTGSKHLSIFDKMKSALDFKDVFLLDVINFIKDNYYDLLTTDQKDIIDCFVRIYLIRNKMKLIFNKYFSRDTFLGTLKIKAYIILYRKGK